MSEGQLASSEVLTPAPVSAPAEQQTPAPRAASPDNPIQTGPQDSSEQPNENIAPDEEVDYVEDRRGMEDAVEPLSEVQAENLRQEAPLNPEITKQEIQIEALITVNNTALDKIGEEIDKNVKDDAARNEEANSGIIWWKFINQTQENQGLSFRGNTLAIPTKDGSPQKITEIKRREGDIFICTTENPSDPNSPLEIKLSRQTVLNAQLQESGSAILSLFPDGPEKKALELQIKLLEEGNSALSDTASVDKIILDSAEKLGLDTTDSYKKFVQIRKDAIKLDTKMDGLEKANELMWLDSLDAAIGEKLLTDNAVFGALTMETDIKESLPGIEKNIAKLKKAVDEGYAEPGDQQRLYRLMMYKNAQELAEKAISEHNFTGTLIEDMQNGTADPERTARFKKALESGDLEGVINEIWQPEDKLKEWMSEEARKRGLKGFGLFTLAAIMIGSMQVGDMLPSLDEQR